MALSSGWCYQTATGFDGTVHVLLFKPNRIWRSSYIVYNGWCTWLLPCLCQCVSVTSCTTTLHDTKSILNSWWHQCSCRCQYSVHCTSFPTNNFVVVEQPEISEKPCQHAPLCAIFAQSYRLKNTGVMHPHCSLLHHGWWHNIMPVCGRSIVWVHGVQTSKGFLCIPPARVTIYCRLRAWCACNATLQRSRSFHLQFRKRSGDIWYKQRALSASLSGEVVSAIVADVTAKTRAITIRGAYQLSADMSLQAQNSWVQYTKQATLRACRENCALHDNQKQGRGDTKSRLKRHCGHLKGTTVTWREIGECSWNLVRTVIYK